MLKCKARPKVCPECGAEHCEECIKTDFLMPKREKRETWLCYICGSHKTIPAVR